MSNSNPNSEDFDPYEISDADYEAMRFNAPGQPRAQDDASRDRYRGVQPGPYAGEVPQSAVPRTALPVNPASPTYGYPPPAPPATPPASNTPASQSDPFASFSPDAYLQQRHEGASGFVNPDSAVPLQGFETQLPAHQPQGSSARLARSRSLAERRDFSIMRDSEPLVRIGTVLFFLVVGTLVSVCWISNAVLLLWYLRR
jgi:hypothetical protein